MPIVKTKNEDFFKKWSPEMAYVFGFFAADGCMIKNNRGAHFIEFHITDKDILLKIRKLLGSNHKISTRNRNSNWKTGYRLQIGSKTMFTDLIWLGMTRNKSKTLKLPKVPDKYFNHFVRGYFDGDGNVHLSRRKDRISKSWILQSGFTSGSEDFLTDLQRKLANKCNISGGTFYRHSGAFRLFFSVKDSIKLYKFMYIGDGNLYLPRKKRIFEKALIKMDR